MSESHQLSLMDAAFHLDEGARSNFIQILIQSLGSSYACLWSFSTPSRYLCQNPSEIPEFSAFSSARPDLDSRSFPYPGGSCLFSLDGLYRDSGNVQSNSIFNQYKQSLFVIQPSHSQVPGLAFMNNMPYVEVKEDQLPTLTSNDAQRQFYQEARIKIAVFMGCRSGEIELGFSNMPQEDLEMQMMRLFPEDFSRNFTIRDLPIPAENPNLPSSSSSSLRSLSMDSPEYSSLLFGLPSTTASSSQALLLTPTTTTATTAANFPSLLARFPTAESEHAAMTSEFLAVMTSPSLSSTTQQQIQQQQQQQQQQQHLHQQQQQQPQQNPLAGAFTRYAATQFKPSSSRRLSMLKRAIAYCRSMNLFRLRERMQGATGGGGGRPISTTQMHHMMSERKRREKLNESFQSLKALLPPRTKKDKASVLAATREYLTSLKSQVEDLRRKHAILEAQRLPPPTMEAVVNESASASSVPDKSRSRVEVTVRTVSDSASTSSQERIVDLHVVARRYIPIPDLVMRILEFLKETRNVNVLSIESDARVSQQDGVANHVSLRLHVEGDEWDESAFREAVRRVVADLAQ